VPSFNHLGDKTWPVFEAAAEIHRRQPPEQPVAEVEVDATNPVAARDQGAADALEKIRLRPLQEEERARDQITFASRSRAIAILS
jgi:hypothetical protein